jgi:23S rRNA (pseudouridine1915-N3)-methyltransferase
VFLIGGAFGFSDEVYARTNAQLSLSKLTFSHQMVRLFFLEQLYRAMTILKGEKYHNE